MPLLGLFGRRGRPRLPARPAVRLAAREGSDAHPEGPHATAPPPVRPHAPLAEGAAPRGRGRAPAARRDQVTRVLFSTEPDDLELYNKPMARNVQIWTQATTASSSTARSHKAGPHRPRREAARRGRVVRLPLRLPRHARRPARGLLAPPRLRRSPGADGANLGTNSVLLMNAPTGYLTAYPADKPDPAEARRTLAALPRPARIRRRDRAVPPRVPPAPLAHDGQGPVAARVGRPARRHAAARTWRGACSPCRTARRSTPGSPRCPARRSDPVAGRGAGRPPPRPASATRGAAREEGSTFARTATREFEEAYWRTIADLAHGQFRTKCSADCVRDDPTRSALREPATATSTPWPGT